MNVDKYYIGWNVVNGKIWPFRIHADVLRTSTGKPRVDISSLVELTAEQAEIKDLTALDDQFLDHPKRPKVGEL